MAELTGSRSIRQRRLVAAPSLPGGSIPVPSVARPSAPSTSADTAHEPSPWISATSSSVARRKPRPGERNEIASMQLVLPAPFGPTSTTTSPRACRLAHDNCGSASATGGGCGRRSSGEMSVFLPSPLVGEGGASRSEATGEGFLRLGQLCENVLQYGGRLLQHVIVPVPLDSKTLGYQDGVSREVTLGSAC